MKSKKTNIIVMWVITCTLLLGTVLYAMAVGESKDREDDIDVLMAGVALAQTQEEKDEAYAELTEYMEKLDNDPLAKLGLDGMSRQDRKSIEYMVNEYNQNTP